MVVFTLKPENLLDVWGRGEWCLHQDHKSSYGLVWPWSLTFWPWSWAFHALARVPIVAICNTIKLLCSQVC